jgi:hypothetical protein
MPDVGFQLEEEQVERGSPFDVVAQHIGRFLSTFLILWATLTSIVSYSRIITSGSEPLAWHETATITISAAAVTVGIAFPLSIAVVEGIPMVFAHFIKLRNREEGLEQGRKQGLEEGREEGRKQGLKEGRNATNRLWMDWVRRKAEAESAGESFDEPPPNLQSSNGANDSSPV